MLQEITVTARDKLCAEVLNYACDTIWVSHHHMRAARRHMKNCMAKKRLGSFWHRRVCMKGEKSAQTSNERTTMRYAGHCT